MNAMKLPCSVFFIMTDIMNPVTVINHTLTCENHGIRMIKK